MEKNNTTKLEKETVVAPEAPKEPVVEISVDKLQSVMDRMDALEKSNAALRETVSSTRLHEAEEKQGVDARPRVHFKKLRDKVVIGWPEKVGEEKKSEIIFNSSTNMPVGEVLKCVYYLHDGTKTPLIDQIEFTRSSDLEFARVLEDTAEDGLLEFENKAIADKPLRIPKKYWNA